jgi:hypothetical protein
MASRFQSLGQVEVGSTPRIQEKLHIGMTSALLQLSSLQAFAQGPITAGSS